MLPALPTGLGLGLGLELEPEGQAAARRRRTRWRTAATAAAAPASSSAPSNPAVSGAVNAAPAAPTCDAKHGGQWRLFLRQLCTMRVPRCGATVCSKQRLLAHALQRAQAKSSPHCPLRLPRVDPLSGPTWTFTNRSSKWAHDKCACG